MIPSDWDDLLAWIIAKPEDARDALVNLQRALTECEAPPDDSFYDDIPSGGGG